LGGCIKGGMTVLLSPNNAYSGRFNVTAPGGSNTSGRVGISGAGAGGATVGGDGASGDGGADASGTGRAQPPLHQTVGKIVAAIYGSRRQAFVLTL